MDIRTRKRYERLICEEGPKGVLVVKKRPVTVVTIGDRLGIAIFVSDLQDCYFSLRV